MAAETVAVGLTGPLGPIPVTEVSYENTINDGVTWSATCPSIIPATWTDTDVWQITAGSWISPALVALDLECKQVGGQGSAVISGRDKASYLLSAEGLSLPTFHNSNADVVIGAIAGQVGVGIALLGTTGLESMRLQEYDVQGGSIGEYIVRILRDAGCNYRIGSSGMFEIFPVDYQPSLGAVVVGQTTRKRNLGHGYDKVILKKSSKAKGYFEFNVTETGLHTGDMSPLGLQTSSISVELAPTSVGHCAYAAFYSGASGGGNFLSIYQMDTSFSIPPALPPRGGDPVAMSVVFAVEPNAYGLPINLTLIVRGAPPQVGDYQFDSEFALEHGSTGERPRILTLESPLYPRRDWVQDHNIMGKLLREANKNNDTVSRDIKFNPYLLPGGYLGADSDAPAARYDTVSFRVGSEVVQQTISGFVFE